MAVATTPVTPAVTADRGSRAAANCRSRKHLRKSCNLIAGGGELGLWIIWMREALLKGDESSLGRLMVMAQGGDRIAYTTLLNECGRWLKRFFYHRIGPQQIDDLVQDTLLSVHRKLSSYDPSRPFLPWLAAIARYRWVDHLRKVYRADETGLDDHIEGFNEEPAIAARISLERMLAYLTPAQERAIELVKIEGMSIAEAAQVTGQSESLVKVNIHRGLKRLAATIEKE